MSKIEREMIAEARAARQKQEAADIGADIPSAPNDETPDERIERAWQYAQIMGHVPPPCREDDAEKARLAVAMLECHGWRWEHGAWQVPNA